jgi:hypothetical protein
MEFLMTFRNCPSILRLQSFQILTLAARLSSLTVLTLMVFGGVSAKATEKPAQAAVKTCEFSDTEFDTTSDIHALDKYRDAVANVLKQEKFEELDCLADAARGAKTRFPGGGWKLRNIYLGLDGPRPGYPTQEDWQHHFELIEQWRVKNPNSITAPIVLAESYVTYGWDARGTGFSDSISQSGRKLFGDRIAKAKEILDEAAADGVKCPDWYVAMQQVAQGQGWEIPDAEALLQKAEAFEPGYQYYYRVHANYLLPKWSGEEGDAEGFAEKAGNQLGGEAGDILYFQIADAIVCGCQDPEFGHFSWPRLQKGYEALERKYGVSLRNVNAFALMASKSNDWVAAEPAFKQIGDNWDKDVWITQEFFNGEKQVAIETAPLQLRARLLRKEAEENVLSPQGGAYRADVEQKLASYEQACVKQAPGGDQKFELLVLVGKDGGVQNAHIDQRPTPVAFCLMRALYDAKVRKETPFSPPPHDSYWMMVEVDPATIAASAK